MAVLLATLYGAFDEVHQAFTPDRSPDVRDLVADCLGAASWGCGYLASDGDHQEAARQRSG